MSNLRKGEVDLYLKEGGDFEIDNINEDMKTTKEEEFRCFEQSIVMRMEHSPESFGIPMPDEYENVGLVYFREFDDTAGSIFASLEHFHGAKLNNATVGLIKKRITDCLVVDEAFSDIDFRVSVIKKNSNSIEVLLMFRIPSGGEFTNDDAEDLLLHYRGIYNTYNNSFGSLYRFDFSGYDLSN